MTIYKKHTKPDGTDGTCSAEVKCRYGNTDAEHSYYDSSIGKNVLNPESTTQKNLNKLTAAELHESREQLAGTAASDSEEYKTAYAKYKSAADAFEQKKEKIISSYPEPKQDFVKQLINTENGPSLIASFEIYDAPTQSSLESTSTDEERVAMATSYMGKVKAEEKYRSLVSSYLVK